MGRSGTVMAVILMGCATSGTSAIAQETTTRVTVEGSDGGGGPWIDGSPVKTEVLLGDDGETYVGVWIDAPDQAPAPKRRAPMAVSLVIDTSGSMSGQKIGHARMAAQSLLETLDDGDIVSVYGFSNGVSEFASPTRLGPGTRHGVMQQVGRIMAGGGTNMYDGLRVASERLSRAPASHPVRRIVLISDGHANIGPSDPQSLGALAGNATEWGTQVTAIGVGLDYDERTLGTLAVRSSGRLYHLERPHQMAQILDRELNLLARTVATDAFIEVVPAKGVTILEGTTFGSSLEGNRLKVPLGSLHAGQQREVLFRAKVDTARVGRRPLATARLSFKHPAGSQRRVVQRRPIRYRVTRQAERAQASQSPRVAAMVATHRAASAQLAAADRLNQGDAEAAVAQLETAERELRTAARQAPAPVRRQLLERARKVQTTRSRARGAGNRPADSRGAALEAFDGAYEAQGF